MNEINFKSVNNSFTKKLLYSVTILLAVSILVFSNISLQGSVIKVLAQASSNTDIQSINNEIVVRVNNDGESYMNDPTIGTAYTGKSVTLSRGNTVSDLISALDSEPAGNNQQYQVLNNNEVVKNDGASLVTGDKLSVKAENGTEVFYKVWLTLDTSNLSDWNNVNTFVADSTGDFGNKNDITKFYVTNDEQFIYFRWDLDELYNGKSNIGAAFSTSADGSTLDGMVWIEFDNPNVVTVFSIEKINGKRSTSYSQDETNVTIFSGSEDSIVAKVSFSDFSEANLTGINNNSVVPLWAQTNASQSSTAAGKDFAPSEGTFFEYNTSNSDYVLGGDGAPPKITVEDSITNETTPTITGTSDEIGGTVTVTINGTEYTGIVESDGSWSVDVTDGLPEGDYTVEGSITDEAGNTTTETGSFTVDTTSPGLELDDDNIVTNDLTPEISGTTDADQEGNQVSVVITDEGDNEVFNGETIVDENGNWNIELPEGEELDDGSYTVESEITDEAGNTTIVESRLELNTTEPTLTVEDSITNGTTPTITGETAEPDGSQVTVTVDGKEYTTTVEDGKWSVDIPEEDELTEGDHTVAAEIIDEAGNTTTATGDLEIDLTDPDLTANDKVTNATTPTITGTSNEIGGTVTVTINGTEYTGIVESDGSWSVDVTDELPEGDYTVESEITDEAGNTTTDSATLRVSTSDPVIETKLSSEYETRKPGESNSYQLKISNNGKTEVDDLTVTIPIPAGFELDSEDIKLDDVILDQDQFEIDGNNLIISIEQLDKDESINVNLPGIINEDGQEVEAGSTISTQARLTYESIIDKIYQQDSNQAVIEVLAVHEITIVEPEIAVGNQGAQAIYPHTLSNAGNSLERVILSLKNLDGYTADWYYDSNGNQELDPNIDQLISAGASSGVEMNALSPGESENIIAAVNIPSDAPESEKSFIINAKSDIEDGIEDNVENTLNIVEISPTLAVDSDPNTIEIGPDNKEYQYEGDSYKLDIDYGNTGDLAIDNPIIKIKLSEHVKEPVLSDIAANNDNIDLSDLSYDSENDIITINTDKLESDQSKSLSVELTLNDDVAQGTEVKTGVEFLQNESGPVLLQKDHIITAVNRGPNQIELTADPEVIYGDGESTSTLTAEINDILGQAVEDGTEVTFRINDPEITADNLIVHENYTESDQTVISSDGGVVTAAVKTQDGAAKIDIKAPNISSDDPLKIPVEARANNDDTGEVSTRIYIVFSPGELIGEVINGNTGLPEAGIEIQLWLNGLKTKTALTDKDGQYSFSIPEDSDNYEIRIIQDNEALTIETGNFAAEADGKITKAPRVIAGKIYYENGDELDKETEIEIYKPDGERYKKDTTFMTTNKGSFYFVLPKENSDSSNIVSALINNFASLFKVRAQDDSNEWTIKAPKFGVLRKVNEPALGQKSFYNDLLIPLNSGIVVDQADNNKKIEGAEVYLTDISGNKIGDSIIVSDTGEYTFKDVSPGEYYLTAEAEGYYDYQEKIVLSEKKNIAQKIEMEKITQDDISITKESNNNNALPDEEVEYTIKIINNKDRKLEGLEVTDALPDKLEYITGSANQDGEYDSDNNQLFWTLDLNPGAALELKYRTKIVDAKIADVLENMVEAEYNGFTFDQVQNNLTVSPDLVITKTAAEEKISIGDFISYKLEVSNNSQYDLDNITVTDKLPPGFKYVQDSAVKVKEDGKEEKLSPTKTDRMIEWSEIGLESESSLEIRYTLVVGSGVVNNKRYINKAYISLGEAVISNTAKAEVLVIEDPLFTTSTVIGKVYLDQNEDGIQIEGETEKGLGGIRIISTTGQIVETDQFGRFHFEIRAEDNIQPMQTLVLKLDKNSLPAGAEILSKNPVIVKIREGLMFEVNFRIK